MNLTAPGIGMNGGVGLHRATSADIGHFTESQSRTFAPTEQNGQPSGYDSLEWNCRMISSSLSYEITLDGMVVGGLIVTRLGCDHFHIVRIWVEPGYQSAGIGSRALALLEASHRQASLWTVEAPSRACRRRHFYKRNGYAISREGNGIVHFEKRRTPILRPRSLS